MAYGFKTGGRKKGQPNLKSKRRYPMSNYKEIFELTGQSVVYIIKAEGLNRYKIGFSKCLVKRICAIITNSPIEIELIHYIKGGRKLEKLLHSHFDDQRHHNEWFDLTQKQVSFLMSISNCSDYDPNKIGLFS